MQNQGVLGDIFDIAIHRLITRRLIFIIQDSYNSYKLRQCSQACEGKQNGYLFSRRYSKGTFLSNTENPESHWDMTELARNTPVNSEGKASGNARVNSPAKAWEKATGDPLELWD